MINLSSIFSELDLFGCQIGLHMNKSFFYKTKFGGFTSVLAVASIFMFFWSSKMNKFYHIEFELSRFLRKMKTYLPNPPIASVNPDEFMFAVGIYQNKRDFLTNPHFNITVRQGIYEKVGQNYTRRNYTIELEPCSNKHWQHIKGHANFTQMFENIGVDHLCPTLDSRLFMQGMFSSEKFAFIEVVVTECVSPNDASKPWNPVCATKQEIDKTVKEDGFYGLDFYHTNYVVNADQPKTYFTPYINDKLYFTFVPYKMTQLCDIYYQSIKVKTDNSLFPTSSNIELDFLTQENNDIKETTQIFRADGTFAILTLRLSPYSSVYHRSYKKVQNLLSELGGFIQIVFVCIGLLVRKYNSFKLTLDLANNLYQFDQEQKNVDEQIPSEYTQRDNKQLNQAQYIQQQINQINQQSFQNQPSQLDNNKLDVKSEGMSQSLNKPSPLKKSPKKINLQKIQSNDNKDNEVDLSQQNHLFLHTSANKQQQNDINFDQSIISPTNNKYFNEGNINETMNQLHRNDNEQLQQQQGQNKISLIQQFKLIISQQKQSLKIGLKYFLSRLTCQKLFYSQHYYFVNKATAIMRSDLDICNILDKLQQIDKIKSVIFTKSQLMLFNYNRKPEISINYQQENENSKEEEGTVKKKQSRKYQKKVNKGLLSEKVEYNTVEQYQVSNKFRENISQIYFFFKQKLYDSYIEIRKQQNSGGGTFQNINQRLIQHLGSNLLEIFRISENEDDFFQKIEQLKFSANKTQINNLQCYTPSVKSKSQSFTLFQRKKNFQNNLDRSPNNVKIKPLQQEINSSNKYIAFQNDQNLKSKQVLIKLNNQEGYCESTNSHPTVKNTQVSSYQSDKLSINIRESMNDKELIEEQEDIDDKQQNVSKEPINNKESLQYIQYLNEKEIKDDKQQVNMTQLKKKIQLINTNQLDKYHLNEKQLIDGKETMIDKQYIEIQDGMDDNESMCDMEVPIENNEHQNIKNQLQKYEYS